MNVTKEQFITRLKVHANTLRNHKLIESPFKKVPVDMLRSLNSMKANKGRQSKDNKNRSSLW